MHCSDRGRGHGREQSVVAQRAPMGLLGAVLGRGAMVCVYEAAPFPPHALRG